MNGVAYVTGNGGQGHPFVFVPGMAAPRDLEAGNAGFTMIANSISTFADTSSVSSQPGDSLLWMSQSSPLVQWQACENSPCTADTAGGLRCVSPKS